MFSSPKIFLYSVFSGTFELFNFELTPGIKVWFIKDDLPEPETPVIATNLFNGISIFMSFKLFVFAPEIYIELLLFFLWVYLRIYPVPNFLQSLLEQFV